MTRESKPIAMATARALIDAFNAQDQVALANTLNSHTPAWRMADS
ncbi:MAG: hypothetical protein QGD92_10685 [Gammaproteobacteria bacterium]|nr:hypothetical protein [Gammaproteobacteria bacterium]